jgi:hypothetical protein
MVIMASIARFAAARSGSSFRLFFLKHLHQ